MKERWSRTLGQRQQGAITVPRVKDRGERDRAVAVGAVAWTGICQSTS